MSRGDLTGVVLDERYHVLEPVGSGAMGNVYRAERVKLGRIVAVKVMNEALQDPAARQRFEREAMAMAKLEHPNCASVVDVGVHADRPYVVMEFVTGQTLRQVMEAGPVPRARAVDITRQILSGLAHAHEHGVIHRDIKPANIVLSHKAGLGDHVKILDFGLARFNKEASNLTSGMVLGTPNYMAPEQIKGLSLDPRLDLYACGVVLFELLAGKKPFVSERNDPVEICMMHLNKPPPRLADAVPGHSFGVLEDVVARALAKDRDQRFATAEEMSRALVDAVSRASAPAIAAAPAPAAPLNATMPLDPDRAVEPAASVTTLATHAAPAPPDPVAPTAAAKPLRPRPYRFVPLAAAGAGIGVIALVLATRGSASSTRRELPGSAAAIEATTTIDADVGRAEDPIEALAARAAGLASAGRRDAAIDVLLAGRKTYPDHARLPYEAAKLYLDKMWWADGLEQARAAIALDARYQTDPELIKLVIRGFNTTKHVDGTLARFLRSDIGAAAKPYLEDTAAGHPNPIVRKRAHNELRHYR